MRDISKNLPAYVNITNRKKADNKGAYNIPLIKQSVIVADRFYNDFHLLNIWAATMFSLLFATKKIFNLQA
ncbi:MAG: hypothetical protein IT239_04840 [Bacteroidia bacterium]|nr:hypothetical protein [Bacteroidia bacterium]